MSLEYSRQNKFPFLYTFSFSLGMYNTTEFILEWEEHSPISFNPDLRLTEYNIQRYWYNESVVIADGVNLRHGAFGKLLLLLVITVWNLLLLLKKKKFGNYSWQLQFIEFYGKFES